MAKGHIDDKKGFLRYFHPSPWNYISLLAWHIVSILHGMQQRGYHLT